MKKQLFFVFLLGSCVLWAQSPGGISGNLQIWVKADAGTGTTTDNVQVSLWENQKIGGVNGIANQGIPGYYADPGISARPVYRTATSIPSFNFNPAIEIVSTDGYRSGYKFPLGFPDNTSNALTSYTHLSRTRSATYRSVFVMNGTVRNSNSTTVAGVWQSPFFGTQGNRPEFYNEKESGDVFFGTNTINTVGTDVPSIQSYYNSLSGGNMNYFFDNNGLPYGPPSNNVSSTSNYPGLVLLMDNDGGNSSTTLAGDRIGEFILYSGTQTPAERQRVNSYLAYKYGITLDQSTPQSYIASDGSALMWDHTSANASIYNKNIAGIGRDNGSALHQKQSHSVNDDMIQVVIAAGNFAASNVANTSNLTDMKFLSWGDNGLRRSYNTPIVSPGGNRANYRMGAVWKAQYTSGFTQPVTVALPVVPANTIYMVRSTDTVFDGSDTWIPMSVITVNGENYVQTTTNIDFSNTDGDYFTFSTFVVGPGGVDNGLRMWLRADKNFTPNLWEDQSIAKNDFTQTNATRQPSLLPADVKYNFNPSVDFGNATAAGAKFMVIPNGKPYTTNGMDSSFFMMINPRSFGPSTYNEYFGFGGTTTTAALTEANWPSYTNSGNNGSMQVYPYTASAMNRIKNKTQLPDYSYTIGGSITYGLDGQNQNVTAAVTAPNSRTAGGAILGSQPSYFPDADFGEAIGYERELTAIEKQRVRSYLAIKYGVTLLQPQNYIAANQSITWNSALDANFNNNIFGMAKDDATILDQVVSNSINTENNIILTISTSNNFVLPNIDQSRVTFLQDNTFLMMGDNNNKTLALLNYGTAPGKIIPRSWLAQRRNNTASTWLQADLSNYSSIVATDKAYMVIANDAAFSQNVQLVPATSFIGGKAVFRYSFPGNKYFTFGINLETYCVKDPAIGTPDGYTKIGISGHENIQNGWPGNVPNGFMALESKDKGIVITRTTSSNIAIPVEGMLIYDTADKCFKLYNGTVWNCIARSCNN
ncbi:hypothetical protein [Chryseobacterium jejuense]|uniref:DUF8202 domain-containing protein n=1 Tax=Chryseobacterium jejuense TaxID=445960 RepID=A0A2X2VNZ9_CHRJE|nr:hypothetical protein [Chryseobacterium jejuense]SDI38987.1 hypothetical protein SAMN05421542_1062 [Chryseobacterium jejuense]SQB26923.1 Uncharacterised protein [Chryseobacterium jejuense]